MDGRRRSSDRIKVVTMFGLGAIATVVAGLVHLGVGVEDIESAVDAVDLIVVFGSIGIMTMAAVVVSIHRSRGS